jgi:hypothetical protein
MTRFFRTAVSVAVIRAARHVRDRRIVSAQDPPPATPQGTEQPPAPPREQRGPAAPGTPRPTTV